MRPSRVLATALATAALLTTAIASGATASATASASGATATTTAGAAPPTAAPVLDWQDCGGGFHCATAVVPRDHDKPKGATFALPLIRKPAADQANRVGSLFLNPGGPGGSGVALVRTAPPPVFGLFSRFDVVGFDPRGVAGSMPRVDCGPSVEDNVGVNKHFVPPHEIDVPAALKQAKRDVARCVAHSPGVLEHVGTANVARDLDLLRRAVGDAKLTYIGWSYGAVIGATYSALFPGRTRAMVLDSPVDPDTWTNRPFDHRMQQNAGFEDSLDRFFMACAAAPDACGLGAGNPEDAFDALVARMNETPLPAPDATHPDPVRGDDLLAATADAMYSVHYRPALAAALAQAAAGDASLLRDLIDGFAGRRPDGTYPAGGSYFAVSAQDFRPQRDVDAYLADAERQYAMFPHYWAYAIGQNLRYAVYPLKQNDVYRGPFTHPRSATPVLVIGGTHDPATPYDMARRLVRQLGNARLLTYQSDGHVASTDFNPCVLGAMAGYVNGLVVPAEGATCTQSAPPLGAAAARTTAEAGPRWGVPTA